MKCVDPERYNGLRGADPESWPTFEAEQAAFGFDGAKLGGALLKSWLLPDVISETVGCGGQPARLPAEVDEGARELAGAAGLPR